MKSSRESLKRVHEKVRDVLGLDLNDFGIQFEGEELISSYRKITLRSEFQKIRNIWSNDIHGHEAHLNAESLAGPIGYEEAFCAVGDAPHLINLDRISRTLHALNFRQFSPNKGMLFLKVHPRLLTDVSKHGRVFERILHAYSIPTQRVVIELQEPEQIHGSGLAEALLNYRQCGYKVAIDGFGKGYLSMELLSSINPDYVKLNERLVHESDGNRKLQRILRKLVEMISDLGAQAIVEGIESETHLHLASDSGASLGQGGFIGKPQSPFYSEENISVSAAA